MSEAELTSKFEALTSELLPTGRGEELFARCLELERVGDLGTLLGLATVRAAAAGGVAGL